MPSLERKLGKDAWEIFEQVCIACLDVDDIQVADVFLSKLEKRFPNSIRVGELDLNTERERKEREEEERKHPRSIIVAVDDLMSLCVSLSLDLRAQASSLE